MTATGRVLNDISVVRGTAKSWNFAVKTKTGSAVDLTGATVYFTAREKYESKTAIIKKTSTVATEIEITSETEGLGNLNFVPGDTKDRGIGKYVYDMWVKLASGKPYAVIKKASLEIEWNVTVITD